MQRKREVEPHEAADLSAVLPMQHEVTQTKAGTVCSFTQKVQLHSIHHLFPPFEKAKSKNVPSTEQHAIFKNPGWTRMVEEELKCMY